MNECGLPFINPKDVFTQGTGHLHYFLVPVGAGADASTDFFLLLLIFEIRSHVDQISLKLIM